MHSKKSHFTNDLVAGMVVFLVAVPLCLGIALASGVPLFSGLIAGIVGGIVVGLISKSEISVSGPAAGLVALVLAGIHQIGSLPAFFLAVMLAGVFQIILGLIKAGGIALFFPNNVIKGMLTAIGIIIIMKQLPHFLGYDKDYEGDTDFFEKAGSNTLSTLTDAFNYFHPGVAICGLVCIVLMILWDKYKPKSLKLIPGALISVLAGLLVNQIYAITNPSYLQIMPEHLVQLPEFTNFSSLKGNFIFPDFSAITNIKVYEIAFTIGLVASIETLLTIEATDKIDPLRRLTPTNRELISQGVGNIVSGLLGGIPLTSVIVRSSANINAGGLYKTSTLIHGILLLIGGIFFAKFLNFIPLTSLAAILLLTGYKLAHPSNFIKVFSKSKYEYLPFIVTVIAIIFTDLLKGIGIGMIISIAFILIGNVRNASFLKRKRINEDNYLHITLAEEVSFLNKAAIRLLLDKIESGSKIIIDASNSVYIDNDILDIIQEFNDIKAKDREIEVYMKGFKENYGIKNTFDAISENY